jgi:hypothetical protein
MFFHLLLVTTLLFSCVSGEMIVTNTSRVCEKFRSSQYTRTPEWRYQLDDDGEYVPRNRTPGLLVANTTVCVEECNNNDRCIAVAIREDGRCIQIAQCFLTNRVNGYDYYIKNKFSNNYTYNIEFGMECKESTEGIHTGVVPATVPDCWQRCVEQTGCKFAEINDMMECVLHEQCEYVYYHQSRYYRRGMIISSNEITNHTMAPTPLPTSSPVTSSPTMPSPTTDTPTTPSPVTSSPVTSSPVTSSPVTSSPTTDTPTTSVHYSSGLTLIQKIGIGLAATLLVLIITLVLFRYYKL